MTAWAYGLAQALGRKQHDLHKYADRDRPGRRGNPARPDRGYTLADLARLAGTSARSLQYGFQERYGTTPMRYLRQVRLDRARDDLAQAYGSVADVAYR